MASVPLSLKLSYLEKLTQICIQAKPSKSSQNPVKTFFWSSPNNRPKLVRFLVKIFLYNCNYQSSNPLKIFLSKTLLGISVVVPVCSPRLIESFFKQKNFGFEVKLPSPLSKILVARQIKSIKEKFFQPVGFLSFWRNILIFTLIA